MTVDWKIVGRFAMAAAVVLAGLIFSAVAIARYDRIVSAVSTRPAIEGQILRAAGDLPAEARVAALLEAEALGRRYDQAQAAMLSKLWTRNMGFVTGMMLALVGAAFVLGELRIDASQVSGGTETAKIAISSSSPGLILCVLGVVLIVTALNVSYAVNAQDAPVYYRLAGVAPVTTDGGRPEPIPAAAGGDRDAADAASDAMRPK